MLRLLGFITGTLLVAIPAFWLFPHSADTSDAAPDTRTAEAVVTPPRDEPSVSAVDAAHTPALTPESASRDGANVEIDLRPSATYASLLADAPASANRFALSGFGPKPEATASSEPIQEPPVAHTLPNPTPKTAAEAPDVASETALEVPPEREPLVQLFWSPFRTELAAKGFARRLSRISGVDVRVAESRPGHYRVGIHYLDEVQKNWQIGQIQARTGLDLDLATLDTNDDPVETIDAVARPVDDARG